MIQKKYKINNRTTEDYTNGCLLDYYYIKIQKELDTDSKEFKK